MEYLLCLDVTESDPEYSNTHLQTTQIFSLYSTASVILSVHFKVHIQLSHLSPVLLSAPNISPWEEARLSFFLGVLEHPLPVNPTEASCCAKVA